MSRPRPHQSLRVPTPSQPTLSFCEATPRDMKRWVAALPKANIGETSRLLYKAMTELSQLATPADNRLQLLELVRPEVHYVCRHLERHFLNQAIVLDERARKVANLCQALENHLAIGYKQIVSQLAGATEKERSTVLAIAIQRALHCLNGPLLRSGLLYCPVPEGLWLEMHQLYQVAIEFNLQHTPVADGLAHHVRALSPEQTYICALLLGTARTNQMRQNAISRLAEVLDPWSSLVRLQPALSATSLFVVAPAQDGPPRYKSLFEESAWPALLGMDTASLAQALKDYAALPAEERGQSKLVVPAHLTSDQLQHLAAAWGDVAERTFQRTPGQGTLRLCVGMSALHYFLSGERAFSDVLRHPTAGRNASFAALTSTSTASADAWTSIYGAQSHEMDAFEEIQYHDTPLDGAMASDSQGSYPTYHLQIVNHSPGGYCLAWPKDVPGQLQAGEMVGIQDAPDQGWSVAVVRWIRQVRTGGTQMGLELLAPYAQPCGLQLIRTSEPNSEYLRALLLPEIRAIDVPATLMAPRLPFQEGNKVNINTQGDERRAALSKRVASTGSFNQFEYRALEQPVAPAQTSVNKTAPQASPEENFDSLWRDL